MGLLKIGCRFGKKIEAEIDSTDLPAVTKFTHLRVRKGMDGLPLTAEGYEGTKHILTSNYGKMSEIRVRHIMLVNLTIMLFSVTLKIIPLRRKLCSCQTIMLVWCWRKFRPWIHGTTQTSPQSFKRFLTGLLPRLMGPAYCCNQASKSVTKPWIRQERNSIFFSYIFTENRGNISFVALC